jgi:hypothetical protein
LGREGGEFAGVGYDGVAFGQDEGVVDYGAGDCAAGVDGEVFAGLVGAGEVVYFFEGVGDGEEVEAGEDFAGVDGRWVEVEGYLGGGHFFWRRVVGFWLFVVLLRLSKSFFLVIFFLLLWEIGKVSR